MANQKVYYIKPTPQPGVSDFGKTYNGVNTDFYGNNAYVGNPPLDEVNKGLVYGQNTSRQQLLDMWAQLQQQYPQYTNHANLNVSEGLGPAVAGQGGKGKLWIDASKLGHTSPEDARYLLAKELGQAVQSRMVTNNASGDELMRLWGQKTPNANAQRYDGLPSANWSTQDPNLAATLANLPNAITVGGYRSFPADVFGTQFAAGLGIHPSQYSSADIGSGLQGPALAYAQANGLVPRGYSPPTVPQRPAVNTNDFGRRGAQQPVPVQAPAVMPAQVNNPMVNIMAQRAAMNGTGPRTF